MNELVDALARAGGRSERRELLARAAREADAQARSRLAATLQASVVTRLYSNPNEARHLCAAAEEWAELVPDPLAAAFALRGRAHVEFTQGNYPSAAERYEAAARAFAGLGQEVEQARTLSSGLQALIYLGRYDDARDWAARAETVFLKSGDALRLARLDSNVGNLHFRLDQPREAIARYERALATLEDLGDDKDLAAVLSNLVVSHTSLGHFAEALAHYRRVSEWCAQRGLPPLSAQADYNIAYLYFLRGEYAEARRAYERSRQLCRQTADAYHAALCDLDESELALELNLSAEGEAFAQQAAAAFEKLGLRYEQAKAYVNLGVAASQQGALAEAARLLRKARALFAAENNRVWPALIDLQRAILAFHDGRFDAARRLSSAASAVLQETAMPARAALAQLLLARLWLGAGQLDRARAAGRQARAHGAAVSSPSLAFHASLLEGEVNERQGKWHAAFNSYDAARRVIEDWRGRLDTEDLRISLLADKLVVYESLVSMLLDSPLALQEGSAGQAWLLVQQAKSRSLADRLLRPDGADALPSPESERLRRQLNWHYRQIETMTLLERSGASGQRTDELRRDAEAIEAQLLKDNSRRERHASVAGPVLAPVNRLAALQRAVAPGSVLVEYFEAREILWAFVQAGGGVKVATVRLGAMAPVIRCCRLLTFQMSKAAKAGGRAGLRNGLAETSHHLAGLYALLVAPLEAHLAGHPHIAFAPHRQLHEVPFGALLDGNGRPLMDRAAISVTPSASVYAACGRRHRPQAGQILAGHSAVIAVPDPLNPHIEQEARAVAAMLPSPKLILGSDATLDRFLREAASARIIHLATHGVFRRDNPLFSALQLAGERLSLLDLSSAHCPLDLLTLSSCSSGAALPVAGDELLGLMRGFLAAGVRRMVVSLWEVDDAATSQFMRAFYRQLSLGREPASALAEAGRQVRRSHPHPYFWAPFVMVGGPP